MTDNSRAITDRGICPVETKLMEESRKMRMIELQQRICRGEYVVDARAVADALVRHLLAPEATLFERLAAQRECS
jgi:hypothetical protein